jgi:DHA1 family tetracycline resistance protein-like MFS transporter
MTNRPGFVILLVTIFIDMLGIGIMWPVLPMLVKDLTGGSIASASAIYGWLVSLYSLMQFAFGPAMGALSDRFGRRTVIILSLIGLTADYLILAVATSVWWVAAARLVGGILGASIATAYAYVADISPAERRAQDFGLLGVALSVGFVAGPFLGGVLGEIGTRVPFIVAAVVSLTAVAFAFFLLPESLPAEKRRRFRLVEANPVGTFAFFRRYPTVIALIAVLVLANLGERLLEANWVLYTGFRYQWGPGEVGLSLGFFGVLYGFVQGVVVRFVVPRLGELRTLAIGLAVGAVSLFLFAAAARGWMLYVILIPYVLAWGNAGPAVQALLTKAVGAGEQGLLQGAIASVGTATGVVAPPIGAGLFAWFISPAAPFMFPGVAFVLGGFLFLAALAVSQSARFRAATAAGSYQ